MSKSRDRPIYQHSKGVNFLNFTELGQMIVHILIFPMFLSNVKYSFYLLSLNCINFCIISFISHFRYCIGH